VIEPESAASVAVLVTRLSRLVYRRVDEQALGMHLKSFVTLSQLREGPMSQQALGEVCALDANLLVLLLNELEQAGFVARRRDPADRRRHIVELTPTGRTALERAERYIGSLEDDVLAALTPEERVQLGELMSRALEGRG
jgi:MarR family transcriptional regulator, temperature-dependent positive regulator of motility